MPCGVCVIPAGHAMALEIMDSMYRPERYSRIYFLSYLYIFFLTLPQSIAVTVVYPDAALNNG